VRFVSSVSFQSVPGAQINGQYPLTNTTPGLTLGRNFSSVAPTVDIVAPGTLYLDRVYQTDIRFTKTVKVGSTTIRPTASIFNLFNSQRPVDYDPNTQTSFPVLNPDFGQPSRFNLAQLQTPRQVRFGIRYQF